MSRCGSNNKVCSSRWGIERGPISGHLVGPGGSISDHKSRNSVNFSHQPQRPTRCSMATARWKSQGNSDPASACRRTPPPSGKIEKIKCPADGPLPYDAAKWPIPCIPRHTVLFQTAPAATPENPLLGPSSPRRLTRAWCTGEAHPCDPDTTRSTPTICSPADTSFAN